MDSLVRGLIENNALRFSAIDAKELVTEARRIHGLSRVATAALGRQLMMTCMMAADLKNATDEVTTSISADGPAGKLICVGRYGALVKGCVSSPETELPPREDGKLDVSGYVGKDGKLSVVRDLSLKEPYVGLCKLVSGEIAEDFAQYFTLSEQQPSLVYLGVHVRAEDGAVLSAGGLVVQTLPNCPAEAIDRVMERLPKMQGLAEGLSQGASLEALLDEIFEGEGLSVTERLTPAYRCDCSRARIERALIALGREELQTLIEEDGKAELCCGFCASKYTFDREQLTVLLQSAKGREAEGEHGN